MKTISLRLPGVAIPLFFACLAGCHCDKNKLIGPIWVLEKYGPESALQTVISAPPPAQTEIRLQLDNTNRFTGSDGCNTIFGAYASTGKCQIRFDSISTTLIFCSANGIMQQAATVTAILKKVNTFKVTDTTLELCAPDKDVLQYRKK
jgi:heat shock protein HslJ